MHHSRGYNAKNLPVISPKPDTVFILIHDPFVAHALQLGDFDTIRKHLVLFMACHGDI